MDLMQDGFFKAYLTALTDHQLDALVDWQDTRLADNPTKDVVADALSKKRLIWSERGRRDSSRRG